MKKAFFLVASLIVYGSLYPFDFSLHEIKSDEMIALLGTRLEMTHKGDLIANVLIFVPLGLFGALWAQKLGGRVWHYISLLAVSFCIAFGLQFLQLYLPSRSASLFDGELNVIGTLAGMGMAVFAKFPLEGRIRKIPFSIPLGLVLCWLLYRLLPFVPSFDWQEIKNSIKPLVLNPHFSVTGITHDFVAWALFFYLSERLLKKHNRLKILGTLLLGCFMLEIVIDNNILSVNNVMGGVLAYVFYWQVGYFTNEQKARILLVILLLFFPLRALMPFELIVNHNTFSWIPFTGFLGNSMYHNTLSFIEKMYFYGAFVWLFLSIENRSIYIALISGLYLLLLEVIQIFLAHHTPEITDPILIVMLVFIFQGIKKADINMFSGILINSKPTQVYSLWLKCTDSCIHQSDIGRKIIIEKVPFYVGRETSQSTLKGLDGVCFEDSPPFQLSRKHFVIDKLDGQPMLKDCNSTLGTELNGEMLGGFTGKKWMPLREGINHITVGHKNHGFKFVVCLECMQQSGRSIIQ